MWRRYEPFYNLIAVIYLCAAWLGFGAVGGMALSGFRPDIAKSMSLGLGLACGMTGFILFLLFNKKLASWKKMDFGASLRLSAWNFLPFLVCLFFLPTAYKGTAPPTGEFVTVLATGCVCVLLAFFASFSSLFYKLEYTFERRGGTIVLFALAALVGLFIALNVIRYEVFGYCGQDTAIYEQSLWTTLHGKFFENSQIVGSQFGNHNNAILLFVVPIYGLFPHALTLHILKVIFLALSAFMVYKLARLYLSGFLSVLLALAFVGHPAICLQNFDDFNESHFGPFFMLLTFYFYYKKQFKYFLPAFILTLSIREDYSLIYFVFGIYALFDRRWGWAGFAACFSVFWFWLSTQVIAPMFPKMEGTTGYWWIQQMYGSWGSSPMEVVKNVLTHPGKVLHFIFYGPEAADGDFPMHQQRLQYIFYIFVPFLLILFLIGAEWIFALPVFFENVLSDHERTTTIYMHYGLPLVVLLMIACVKGLERLGRLCERYGWRKKIVHNGACLAMFAIGIWTFYHFIVQEQIREGEAIKPYYFKHPGSYDLVPELNEIVRMIPDDTPVREVRVFMPRYMAPKLANRMHLKIQAPVPTATEPHPQDTKERVDQCDYFILHHSSGDAKTLEYLKNDFIIGLPTNPEFRKIYDRPGEITVYKRNALDIYLPE